MTDILRKFGPFDPGPRPTDLRADLEKKFQICKLRNKQTATYEGELKKNTNVREGLGKLIKPQGYYEGWFKDDKYHGYGRMVLDECGGVYEGLWVHGKK